MNDDTKAVFARLGKSNDGKVLYDFYSQVLTNFADVRKLKECTNEELKGRQIACDLIQTELLDRLKRHTGATTENKTEFI